MRSNLQNSHEFSRESLQLLNLSGGVCLNWHSIPWNINNIERVFILLSALLTLVSKMIQRFRRFVTHLYIFQGIHNKYIITKMKSVFSAKIQLLFSLILFCAWIKIFFNACTITRKKSSRALHNNGLLNTAQWTGALSTSIQHS